MEQTTLKLINTRPRFFGIEFMHAVIIATVFICCYLLTFSFLFVLVVSAGLYMLSKLIMARKARSWLEDLLLYHFGAHYYSAFDPPPSGKSPA